MEPQQHDLQLLQVCSPSASGKLSLSTNALVPALVHHMDREKSVTMVVVADADLAPPSAAGSSADRVMVGYQPLDHQPLDHQPVVEVLERV